MFWGQESNLLLRKSLDTINKINSYSLIVKAKDLSAYMLDTTFVIERCKHEINRNDFSLGYKFVNEWDDYPQIHFPVKGIFDGEKLLYLNWKDSTARIDDLTSKSEIAFSTFRSIYEIRNIIQCYLNGEIDNLKILKDDTVDGRICKVVYFTLTNKWFLNGKISLIKEIYSTTEYRLWIDNSDFIPRKIIWKKNNFDKNWKFESSEYSERIFEIIALNNQFEISIVKNIPKQFKIVNGYNLRSILPINTKSPSWESTFINGNVISSKNLYGNLVIIEFSMISCGACILSIPFLNDLQERFKMQKLNVISVFVGNKQNEVIYLKDKMGIKYNIIADSTQKIGNIFKISAFPSIYIIDKEGVIRYSGIGFGEEVEKKILETLFLLR